MGFYTGDSGTDFDGHGVSVSGRQRGRFDTGRSGIRGSCEMWHLLTIAVVVEGRGHGVETGWMGVYVDQS